MLEDLSKAPKGSIIVLQPCAHNPTGCDPTRKQWHIIAEIMQSKILFPFFDMAYQGFASGDVDGDAYAVRLFAARGMELFCAQSYSKIFGLYGERIGNLAIVHQSPSTVDSIVAQLSLIVHNMYLNPPKFGAQIVEQILCDEKLRLEWFKSIKIMSERMRKMRANLFDELIRLDTPGSWNHIVDQIGMFSYTGLNGSNYKNRIKAEQ